MLNPEIVGKNIRKNREKLNLTQQELAQKLFVSFQAVSAWERGQALPDLENASKLADFFNVKLDTLLYDTESSLFVAIDGGGTKTEFVLFEKDGHIKKRLVLEGTNPNDIGTDKSISIICRGIDGLLSNSTAKSIFAGIAGVTTGNHIQVIQKALSDKYGIPTFVDTDAVNVLSMGKDPQNTASIICGTGSCVFVRKDYKLTRIGGWGYLFDRAGSAYDIGNDAIRHTLAVFDGLEKADLLSTLVEKHVGGNIWTNLSSIYAKGRPYIASFAPLVIEGANNGDKTSIDILKNNAKRLAQLINLAKEKHGAPDEFVCSGGFFKNAYFRELVQESANIKLFAPDTQPVYGACIECIRLNNIQPDIQFKNNFLESYR